MNLHELAYSIAQLVIHLSEFIQYLTLVVSPFIVYIAHQCFYIELGFLCSCASRALSEPQLTCS